MRKKVKVLIFIILIVSTIIIINISKTYAEEEIKVLNERTEKSVAKLTCGNTEKYYDYLDAAIEDACDYDTITLLKDVNEDGYEKQEDVLNIYKKITFELGTYTIYSRGIYLESYGPVTFNAEKIGDTQGGIITNKKNVHTINMRVWAAGVVKLNNVKIIDNVNTDNFATIFVDAGTLEIDGNTYISTVSNAIEMGANLQINNLELLQSKENYAIYYVDCGNMEINGGKLIEGKKGGIYSPEVESCSGMSIQDVTIRSQDGAGVTYSGDYSGIYIGKSVIESINGPGTVLNISEISILYSNSISGGTIKSQNGPGIIVNAMDNDSSFELQLRDGTIYSQNNAGVIVNSGKLIMRGSSWGTVSIEGIVGVVVNGGITVFEGGTVNGTGSGKGKIEGVGTSNEIELGSAIVNNISNENAIQINGGTFNSSGSVTLSSVIPENNVFSVKKGIYNKPFDFKFVEDGILVVHITNADGEKWYVGSDAEYAVRSSKQKTGTEIEVMQGDLEITDGVNGLKVKNSGVGNVVANNQNVAQGSEIIIEQSQQGSGSTGSESQGGTKPGSSGSQESGNPSGSDSQVGNDSSSTGTQDNSKSDTSKENVITKISTADNTVSNAKLPKTGDLKTILLVIGAIITSASIIITYLKIRRAEGK